MSKKSKKKLPYFQTINYVFLRDQSILALIINLIYFLVFDCLSLSQLSIFLLILKTNFLFKNFLDNSSSFYNELILHLFALFPFYPSEILFI